MESHIQKINGLTTQGKKEKGADVERVRGCVSGDWGETARAPTNAVDTRRASDCSLSLNITTAHKTIPDKINKACDTNPGCLKKKNPVNVVRVFAYVR